GSVDVESLDARIRVAHRVVPEIRHRQAPLPCRDRFTAHLDDAGVDDRTDAIFDVVAERPQADADLRRRDPGAPRHLHGVDEVGDESTHAVVDRVDRRAGRAQHRVAVEADLADRHAERIPSTTSDARVLAAWRVAGARSWNVIVLPVAIRAS